MRRTNERQMLRLAIDWALTVVVIAVIIELVAWAVLGRWGLFSVWQIFDGS